ncbi:hypothetical protein EDC04DRAFT_3136406 [Pisolithus marmoratus]|nr:hypothetical protein EDC04DRAFT_3136406 [Pisolithus marmoratus]
MSPFRPTTRSMSRKGMRHYSPYNLRSRGSRQTFECLPTPSASPTRPRSSATHRDAGGLWTPAGDSVYDAARRAVLDGIPLSPQDILCHSVLLGLARDCAETTQAVFDEQRRIILAFDAGQSISDNELKLFHPTAVGHIETFLKIANTIIDDLEHKIWTHPVELGKGLAW